MCVFSDVYPSSYKEWQPVESIVGVFNVTHGFIGEQQYAGRLHSSLAKIGIYFNDHFYHMDSPSSPAYLEKLPLPDFTCADWLLPSCNVSESFRCKLFQEVHKGLKPNIASRVVKIKVSMPIDVFVDFFAGCSISQKNTMLVCRDVDYEKCLEFLDEGWDCKVENGIHCAVCYKSISVKYMIRTQNFIMTYYYKRSHFVNGDMVALDQDPHDLVSLVNIYIWANNEIQTVISLGQECTMQQLRNDIIIEDEVELPAKFIFQIDGSWVRTHKY